MIKISEFVRLREAADLTQTDLAKRVPCSQQLVSEIESGKVRTTKKIYKIAAILGVSASQLDPDIPAHRLERYFADIEMLDPADSEWVLSQLRRDLATVKKRSVGRISEDGPTHQTPPDGAHKREKTH